MLTQKHHNNKVVLQILYCANTEYVLTEGYILKVFMSLNVNTWKK